MFFFFFLYVKDYDAVVFLGRGAPNFLILNILFISLQPESSPPLEGAANSNLDCCPVCGFCLEGKFKFAARNSSMICCCVNNKNYAPVYLILVDL